MVGVAATKGYDKYLGFSAFVGRSKLKAFAAIQGRVQKFIDGWKERFLSQARKEILIKAVLQAIPAYSMSIFLLPKKLCNTLNAMISRFWWRHQSNTHKIAWVKWARMGAPNNKGGMGFRDLEIFNLALLAKQGWRLIQHPNALVPQILREKYFPEGSFLSAALGRTPSLVWRSIFRARGVLEGGLRWRVGNGESIKIWGDKWLPIPLSYQVQSPVQILDPEARVSSLIDSSTGLWDVALIRSLFWPDEADIICGLPLSPMNQPDKVIWGVLQRGSSRWEVHKSP